MALTQTESGELIDEKGKVVGYADGVTPPAKAKDDEDAKPSTETKPAAEVVDAAPKSATATKGK